MNADPIEENLVEAAVEEGVFAHEHIEDLMLLQNSATLFAVLLGRTGQWQLTLLTEF